MIIFYLFFLYSLFSISLLNVALLCGLLCSGGAVFQGAAAFNGDLSKWNVGVGPNMGGSTYTLYYSLVSRYKTSALVGLDAFPPLFPFIMYMYCGVH